MIRNIVFIVCLASVVTSRSFISQKEQEDAKKVSKGNTGMRWKDLSARMEENVKKDENLRKMKKDNGGMRREADFHPEELSIAMNREYGHRRGLIGKDIYGTRWDKDSLSDETSKRNKDELVNDEYKEHKSNDAPLNVQR